MKSRSALRLVFTACLFVTVLALAQSTEIGRIHENCQSLGKNWTKFDCPFDPNQRRCLGLEIAYEASPECGAAIVLVSGLPVFVPQVPAYGALDHYLGGTPSLPGNSLTGIRDVSYWVGDGGSCGMECEWDSEAGVTTEISLGCCLKLCQDALGFGSTNPPPAGSSCPR
jgi:hypothetical protein